MMNYGQASIEQLVHNLLTGGIKNESQLIMTNIAEGRQMERMYGPSERLTEMSNPQTLQLPEKTKQIIWYNCDQCEYEATTNDCLKRHVRTKQTNQFRRDADRHKQAAISTFGEVKLCSENNVVKLMEEQNCVHVKQLKQFKFPPKLSDRRSSGRNGRE